MCVCVCVCVAHEADLNALEWVWARIEGRVVVDHILEGRACGLHACGQPAVKSMNSRHDLLRPANNKYT